MIASKNYLAVLFCRGVALALCMSLVTGCTTFKPVSPLEPQSVMELIKPGDEVQLTTRDGREREFKVKEATTHQLVGESETVNLSDITDLERREFSTGKTVGLVAGIIGGVLLVVLIVVAVSAATSDPYVSLNSGR